MKLPHRITIESRSTTKDTLGGQSTTWSTLGVFYCRIRPLTGRALEAAQALHAEVSHEIEMRYTAAVTPAHRGRYCGRIFEFGPVLNPDEANVKTRILAREGLTEG